MDGRKRSRASVLKHGRYSAIEREVEAWFQEGTESMRQLAASTRNRFMRELYTRIANQKTTRDVLGTILDAVNHRPHALETEAVVLAG